MTVVNGHAGACGAGTWYLFTPENLQFGDNYNYASAFLDSLAEHAQSASSFGFAIPADATITSLTVYAKYCFRLAATGSARFLVLAPSYDGVIYGVPARVDLAADEDASEWTTVEGAATTNLPTVAQLNSPDFAVTANAYRHAGSNTYAYLSYIQLTVEYDEYVPPEATVPTVTTSPVTGITPNWASSGGTVTAENGSAVTERGICWGAGDVTLETADGGVSSGGGMGVYSCVAVDLAEQKGYMLRAYAVNAVGVAYGVAVYFETPRGMPTVTTSPITDRNGYQAWSGGTVTSEGWAAVTARGILWGAGDVTLETADGVAVDPGAQGGYVCVAEPLVPSKGYMLRAYAVNSYGVAYGDAIYFETLYAPTVVTTAVIAIMPTTATGGGIVTSAGGGTVTDRGLCWGTSPNPRTKVSSGGGAVGAFAIYLMGLAPGTRYFVAAWATNFIGAAATTYGADVTFVTVGVPTIATAGVYDIDATVATSGGNVASDGGGAVTARGVCWSIAENPTTAANLIPAMTGATAPSGVASESGHVYTYAAWMAFDHTNPVGGASGTWVSNAVTGWIGYQFPAPHVVTGYAVTSRNEAAPNVQAPKTWTFKGSNNGTTWVTLDTQTNVTDWAASPNVRKVFHLANTTAYLYYRLDITASNGASLGVGELEMVEAADDTLDGSGLGAFASYLTGLTENVTYNVRAYATNLAGIAYGAAVVFTATANEPPVEPPPGPPRDPSENLLFDGTLELKVGTLDVAGSATQVKYSNSNPGGFGNLSFRLPANAPWGTFDAQVVKDAAVTMKHGLVGFAATLFEGEVTSDVSHATIEGGDAYYDVTCAGLWWKAGQRKDFSMVIGDDDYGQWFAMDDNAKAFQVSTDGCLEIRVAAGQSVAAGDSASLYYWLGKGMGDPAATVDFLFGLLGLNTVGSNWVARVWSAPTPWGPWTACIGWTNGSATGLALSIPTLGDNPQALKLELSTTSAGDMTEDRFVRLDKASVGSGVSANGLSAVSVGNPAPVTATSAHGLRSGDRVFITQSAASTPTISGWRTVTVTNATHFTVPVAVTTAGGAGTFYKATRIDQALVEIAVTPGLATLASLQPGGIGNLNWGLVVRPHASRAGGIDLLAATNVAPFDYGFWDEKTFYCQDRPEIIRARPLAATNYFTNPGFELDSDEVIGDDVVASGTLAGTYTDAATRLCEYEGVLYVGSACFNNPSSAGMVWALDPSTNALTLAFDTGEQSVRSMCVYDGVLYAGTGVGAQIFAWDGSTMTLAHAGTGGTSVICAAVYAGKLYMGGTDGVLYCYDGSAWSTLTTLPTPIESLTTFDGLLFACCGNEDVGTSWTAYASDGLTAWLVHQTPSTDKHQALSVCPWRGCLFVGEYDPTGNASVTKYDPAAQTWTVIPMPAPYTNGALYSLVVYHDRLYIGSHGNGKLFRYDGVTVELVEEIAGAMSLRDLTIFDDWLYIAARPDGTPQTGGLVFKLRDNYNTSDGYVPAMNGEVYTRPPGRLGGWAQRAEHESVADSLGYLKAVLSASGSASPGEVFTFSAYYKVAYTGTADTSIGVVWLGAGNSFCGVDVTSLTTCADWTRFSVAATAPANATHYQFQPVRCATENTGDTFDITVDDVLIEKSAVLTPYFDGTYPECSWEGAANASQSTWAASALALPAARALHDYLIDSSLPGIDFDVRKATEDSPTVVKVLHKFRAEDGETSSYPDGTALAVYRDVDPATGLGRTYAGDWSDASVVLDVWNEWADLSLTTAQAGDLGDQILAWLSANAYQGGGTIAPATLPLRAEGTKPVAYIRAGDYIEDSNLDTGPLMITGFSMDADRGIATLGIGENRRAFVERLTPDKA